MLNGRNRPHYRLVIPIVLGAAVAFLFSGCMWGFVTDHDTGAPIGGATVSYTDANGDTDSTTTNANGLYSFDQAVGPYPARGTADFEISAPGYDTLTTTRLVAYDDNPNATLANLSSFWEVRNFTLQPTAAEPAKIVFSSARDGNTEIYVMDADGSGQTRLTTNPAYDANPAWSPDGSKIAFTSARDGNAEIYVMNANGSGQTRLTTNPASDESPDWSPDRSQIAFTTGRDGNLEIYVMDDNGSGQTNLSNDPAGDAEPAWSPDGSKIAFTTARDGNWEIYVMDDNGTDQARLTHNSALDNAADW